MKNKLTLMSKILDHLSGLKDNSFEDIEIDGFKVHLYKGDGALQVEIEHEESEEKFDDSEVKELVKEYKESFENLDYEIVKEVLKEMAESIDFKKFNDLLNKDTYNQEEADMVTAAIDTASTIIQKVLDSKITSLMKLYNRF